MQRAICFVLSMYHDASRVRAFVAHLRQLPCPRDVELHIVVTDNGRERRRPLIPGADIVTPRRNLGYLGGCVHALESWRAAGHAQPEWVCVSNTDLELADDFLLRLTSEECAEDVGVVAPDVRLVNGAPQNPLLWRRPARLMMLAYAVLARSRMFARAFETGVRVRHVLRLFGERSAALTDPAIYAPHGSIVLLHRRFFERGAELRYGALMFGEEIHIAEQARRIGLRVIWRRDLRVVHEQHASVGRVRTEQRHRWLAESADVLWRDYFAEAGDA